MTREPLDQGEVGKDRLAIAFFGAIGLSLLLPQLPYGRYLLYPFFFLGTWAHEMGHGLTALLVGRSFEKLVIRSDFSGTAWNAGSAGGALGSALISAGGLLGPALAGALVIVLGARPRLAPWVAVALGLAMLGSLALWVRGELFGIIGTAVVGLGLLALARAPATLRVVVTQLLGIQLALASFGSVDYMFTKEFKDTYGQTKSSDVQHMAEALVLPYFVWGALVAVLSLAVLLVAFWFAWMRGEGKKRPA